MTETRCDGMAPPPNEAHRAVRCEARTTERAGWSTAEVALHGVTVGTRRRLDLCPDCSRRLDEATKWGTPVSDRVTR